MNKIIDLTCDEDLDEPVETLKRKRDSEQEEPLFVVENATGASTKEFSLSSSLTFYVPQADTGLFKRLGFNADILNEKEHPGFVFKLQKVTDKDRPVFSRIVHLHKDKSVDWRSVTAGRMLARLIPLKDQLVGVKVNTEMFPISDEWDSLFQINLEDE